MSATTSWQPAQDEPGELVTAAVTNPLENPGATGKVRPVILVRRQASRWHVMGLTSRSTYRNGQPRTPVPNPAAVGLRGPGYLWGQRLTAISVLDVYRHLGWVDTDLAEVLMAQANLCPDDVPTLVHHPIAG